MVLPVSSISSTGEDAVLAHARYVFDVDGTLTESRSLISQGMEDCLAELLARGADVLVISGARAQKLYEQIPLLSVAPVWVMAQSGNSVWRNGAMLWQNCLDENDAQTILAHIDQLRRHHPIAVVDEDDLVDCREGHISYSLIGHNASPQLKKAFDPDGSLRKRILREVPFRSDKHSVMLGGTTTLGYSRCDWDKKGNLLRLFRIMGWRAQNAVYFGDKFGEGGNDEPVRALISTIFEVRSPSHTNAILRCMLGTEKPHRP